MPRVHQDTKLVMSPGNCIAIPDEQLVSGYIINVDGRNVAGYKLLVRDTMLTCAAAEHARAAAAVTVSLASRISTQQSHLPSLIQLHDVSLR